MDARHLFLHLGLAGLIGGIVALSVIGVANAAPVFPSSLSTSIVLFEERLGFHSVGGAKGYGGRKCLVGVLSHVQRTDVPPSNPWRKSGE